MKRILLALVAALVAAPLCAFEPTPYVGIEMHYRHTPHKAGYGKEIFPKRAVTGNALAGLRLNQYFGLEAGIHTGKTDRSDDFAARVFHIGHHYSVVGFLPLIERMEGFLGLGVNLLRHSYSIQAPEKRTYESSKTLLRLMGGAHYSINDRLVLRGSATWNNTNVMKTPTDLDVPSFNPGKTYSLGMGILFKFI
jgi:hypothetical protein